MGDKKPKKDLDLDLALVELPRVEVPDYRPWEFGLPPLEPPKVEPTEVFWNELERTRSTRPCDD